MTALVSVIGAMNRAYGIDENRPWWKVRLTAIVLTIALSLFVVIAFTLICFVPLLALGQPPLLLLLQHHKDNKEMAD